MIQALLAGTQHIPANAGAALQLLMKSTPRGFAAVLVTIVRTWWDFHVVLVAITIGIGRQVPQTDWRVRMDGHSWCRSASPCIRVMRNACH